MRIVEYILLVYIVYILHYMYRRVDRFISSNLIFYSFVHTQRRIFLLPRNHRVWHSVCKVQKCEQQNSLAQESNYSNWKLATIYDIYIYYTQRTEVCFYATVSFANVHIQKFIRELRNAMAEPHHTHSHKATHNTKSNIFHLPKDWSYFYMHVQTVS